MLSCLLQCCDVRQSHYLIILDIVVILRSERPCSCDHVDMSLKLTAAQHKLLDTGITRSERHQ